MNIRTYIETTVDLEFQELGSRGYTGSLNDRVTAFLVAQGYTGSVTDMLRAWEGDGSIDPGGTPATVPDAFVDADWSVATGSAPKELDITIVSLPANGGAAITDVEYDVDASGTWVSLGQITSKTITMAASSTSYNIRLRAVNSVGNSAAGNVESATSGAAAAGPVTITHLGASLTFDEGLDTGTYANGDKWVNAAGGNATLSSSTPAFASGQSGTTSDSTAYTGRSINGAMLNPGDTDFDTAEFGSKQGYDGPDAGGNPDSLIPSLTTEELVYYDLTLNIDPGYAGDQVLTEGTVVKQISNASPSDLLRDMTDDLVPFTITASAPASGAFRPGVAATSKTSKWNESDIDYTVLSNLTAPASATAIATVAATMDQMFNVQWTNGLSCANIAPVNSHNWYGREIGNQVGLALLTLHLDYTDAQKRDLAVYVCQLGIDVYERIVAGGIFPDLGGGNHWRKAALVMTAELLNDDDMRTVCADLTKHTADRQIFDTGLKNINTTPYTGDGNTRDAYEPHMFGMVDWGDQHLRDITRDGSNWGVQYRWVGASLLPQVLAVRLTTGGVATWGNSNVFDYIDRFWMREEGSATGTTNGITQFAHDMFTSHRGLSDAVAPLLDISAVADDGLSVILRYDEHLDELSVPATGDFTVTDDAVGQTITAISVMGLGVKVTVSAAMTGTVLVSYTAGTNKLRDYSGNNAANLSSQTCTDRPVPLVTLDDIDVTAIYTADDLSYLFKNDDGTGAVTADGDNVEWWGNEKGTSVPFTHAGSTPPTYQTGSGLHWILANAAGEDMSTASRLQLNSGSDEAVFGEVETVSAGTDPRILRGSADSIGSGLQIHFGAARRPRAQVNTVADGYNFTETSFTVTDGVPICVSGLWRESDGVLFYYTNDTYRSQSAVGAGRTLVDGIGHTLLGGTTPNLKMYGLAFSRNISSTNTYLIRQYLGQKSGRIT